MKNEKRRLERERKQRRRVNGRNSLIGCASFEYRSNTSQSRWVGRGSGRRGPLLSYVRGGGLEGKRSWRCDVDRGVFRTLQVEQSVLSLQIGDGLLALLVLRLGSANVVRGRFENVCTGCLRG